MSASSADQEHLLPAHSRAGGHFARALIDAAERDDRVVGLTADLAKYTDMVAFRERFPARFVNVGMAEQNLVAVASGLEMAGYRPVATTFAVFLTRRAFDFVVMQVAVHGGNVKLVAGLPGVCTTFGPSHQAIDDLAHMRALPGMTVLDPCDPLEMGLATQAMLELEGPVYMRQLFGKEPIVIDPDTSAFEVGRAHLMKSGNDVGIVASSIMVKHALDAAEELERSGINTAVMRVSTLKPFDGDAVAELASSVDALITAENHSVIGGLYSATAESLLHRGVSVPTEAIGLQDEFGSFGSLEHNLTRHGLTSDHIVSVARQLLGERRGAPPSE